MSLNNITLDIEYVKAQFPAFTDPLSSKWTFMENAGGSYVPHNVINHLNNFMTSTKVQPYADFDMSKIAGQNMDKATKLFADMINAQKDEIIVSGSTTMNMYVLSNAIKHILKPGDEYQYNSGSHLKSPMGTMQGSYIMANAEGIEFEVKIPCFTLSIPGIIN